MGGSLEALRGVIIPRLHLSVPGWILRRMLDPEFETRALREAWEKEDHP